MSSFSRIAMAALVGAGITSGSGAMAQGVSLVPFDQFVGTLSTATPGAQAAASGAPVVEAAAFGAMRSHVMSLYSGVRVTHSFLLDQHPYDCVPIAQQPSVRLQGLTAVASPPVNLPATAVAAASATLPSQLDDGQKVDALGNSVVCEGGTIPMRRVTLDDVSRFKTLQEFFQKGPNGAGQVAQPGASPAATILHKYAHSYENIANVGGTSFHNLWNEAVNTNAGEVFSLDQFWYVNRTGAVQTLEMGLQNYPQKYNTTNTVLFIYWTSDGYNNVGCYNLDCSGFVQTNSNVYLGKGFKSYSQLNGVQYAPQLTAFLSGGNWWLYLNGGAAANAIGYYPGSVYHGTPMTRGANEIDYGGEVTGTTIWPPMGSGQFAATGFRQSAYVRNIVYFPNVNSALNGNLTVSQPSPSCFTDILGAAGSSWGTYFYYGGPGGRGC